MRITEEIIEGQSRYVITISPNEPFLIVKLGICFLDPVSSPGGCTADPVFKQASHNYVFHADEVQLADFSSHMDVQYRGWSDRVASDDGKDIYGAVVPEPREDDPTDRGIKLQAVKQGKAELDALFEPYERERKRGRRAIAAAAPQRDIDRSQT